MISLAIVQSTIIAIYYH